ncbi:MAG: DUF2764 family protein [Bacteroidales bacterium]
MRNNQLFRKYYHCLIAGLPDILLDESELSFSLIDFKNNLENELYDSDYKLVQKLFLPYDNKNLLNFLQEKYKEFEKLGNYSPEIIERELDPEEKLNVLPGYMYRFIDHFREEKDNKTIKEWENLLTEMYYEYALDISNNFLQEWLTFELNVTNLLTGINCRKFNRDPENEIIGDNFVSEAIKRSSAKDFGLDVELEYTNDIIQIAEKDNLLTREKNLDQYKWEKINELILFYYFSIEVVMAYILKLNLVYRWMSLDEKTGREMFEKLIDELKDSFEFSKDFIINEQRR